MDLKFDEIRHRMDKLSGRLDNLDDIIMGDSSDNKLHRAIGALKLVEYKTGIGTHPHVKSSKDPNKTDYEAGFIISDLQGIKRWQHKFITHQLSTQQACELLSRHYVEHVATHVANSGEHRVSFSFESKAGRGLSFHRDESWYGYLTDPNAVEKSIANRILVVFNEIIKDLQQCLTSRQFRENLEAMLP